MDFIACFVRVIDIFPENGIERLATPGLSDDQAGMGNVFIRPKEKEIALLDILCKPLAMAGKQLRGLGAVGGSVLNLDVNKIHNLLHRIKV